MKRHLFLAAVAAITAAMGAVLAPAVSAGPPYQNCSEAHADGRYNIPKGDEAYRSKLDRDGDGLACEPKP
ncbi:excalibur calcium-binding domain-containing protein [Mycobacterium sp. pW045]|uniref:excalibur calcium-binding domain-containing protein n=1 Tax=Mycobacterium sp. pW045 TaxID=3238984 RepID=UPI00351BA9AF